ncbi:MAG: MarR family winged helix-turn-helix transcriptional regulator [Chloroflexota bacterium]
MLNTSTVNEIKGREALIERFIGLQPLVSRRFAMRLSPEQRQELGKATVHQMEALSQLYPEGRTMSELARLLGVTDASITALADRLTSQGLVERCLQPGDRRVVRLALTDQARAFVEVLRTAKRQAALEALSALDDEHMACLVEAFEVLAAGAEPAGSGVVENSGHGAPVDAAQ